MSKSMFLEMVLSWSPLLITSTATFAFLEKISIQCHRRLVEEKKPKRRSVHSSSTHQVKSPAPGHRLLAFRPTAPLLHNVPGWISPPRCYDPLSKEKSDSRVSQKLLKW